MVMTGGVRRFALTAHVASSVGWIGTVAAFQALAIAAVRSQEPEAVRAFYLAMELIGWYVILPFCVASLLTGLLISLGTPWGLFRHYWVLVKFLLTVVAALVLVGFTQTLGSLGDLAANATVSVRELRNLKQSPVLHSGGGLLVLLGATVLAVYKPWGMTPYGRRKQGAGAGPESESRVTPSWKQYLLLWSMGLIVLFLVMHLIGGGPRGH
jgi:hypothetical protein